MDLMSILMEGRVRVGLDNICYYKDVHIKGMAEMVERVVETAKECRRDVAASQEAGNILKLP